MLTMSQGESSGDEFDCRLSNPEYNLSDEDDSWGSSVGSRIRSNEGASSQAGPCLERPAKRPRSSATLSDVEWREVNHDVDLDLETWNYFRFLPKASREPGLNANPGIDETSTPLCLKTLITEELFHSIIEDINNFASLLVAKKKLQPVED